MMVPARRRTSSQSCQESTSIRSRMDSCKESISKGKTSRFAQTTYTIPPFCPPAGVLLASDLP